MERQILVGNVELPNPHYPQRMPAVSTMAPHSKRESDSIHCANVFPHPKDGFFFLSPPPVYNTKPHRAGGRDPPSVQISLLSAFFFFAGEIWASEVLMAALVWYRSSGKQVGNKRYFQRRWARPG